MRITLIRRAFDIYGGAENYLMRFARRAVEEGHVCKLICAESAANKFREIGDLHLLEAKSPILFANEVAKLIKSNPPDGELIFSLERVWACDVYRAGDGAHAAYLARRGARQSRWQRLVRKLRRVNREMLRLESSLYGKGKNVRMIIANSSLVANDIEKYYQTPRAKICVVNNGCELPDKIKSELALADKSTLRKAKRRELGVKDDELAILFLGAGWQRKGLQFLAKACEKVVEAQEVGNFPNFKIIVCGVAEKESKKLNLSKKAHAHFNFRGKIRDVWPYHLASDIFCLPSYYDPFSNATLEAMHCGRPIITTTSNGASEFLKDGENACILSKPEDLINGFGVFLRLWSTKEARRHAAGQLLRIRSRLTVAENLRRTLAVLQAVAEEKQREV